jgi:hypothetical protein
MSEVITGQADFNPYKLGKYMYSIVAEYLETKYNVTLTEEYPKEKVSQPTICVRTFKRSLGGGKHGTARNSGPTFSRELGYEDYDQNIEQLRSDQNILLEFAVFGTSSSEAEDIAWDLETLLVESEGIFQTDFEGLVLVFNGQMTDGNFSWRQQDELNIRTFRFQVILPIRYKRILPRLKEIKYERTVGKSLEGSTLLIRTASESTYEITSSKSNLKIVGIEAIRKQRGSSYFTLIKGVDFQEQIDVEGNASIIWLDDVGAPPLLGERFYVDYWVTQEADPEVSRFGGYTLPKTVIKSDN